MSTLHECIEPISTYVCASESVEKISVASQLQSICVSFYTLGASIGINTMEINTKLLVADGDIVVIGGIKKNVIANSKSQTPGLGNVPVIGNLFKGKSNSQI